MANYGYADIGKLADFANNSWEGLSANDIMRFPKADVQPVKHGKWLKVSENSWNNYKCSLCNNQYVGMGAITFTYCPNCGARMDLNE